MFTLRTPTGSPFQYKRHPDGEIIVYSSRDGELQNESAIVITPFTINLVKQAIKDSKEIRMGASRDKPPAGSLGALLKDKKQSPQQLSYLIPILKEEGFCYWVKDGQAVIVRYKGATH